MESRPISEGTVAAEIERAGFVLPPACVADLTRYLNLLRRWNRVYNLTGIRDDASLIERHLIESLSLGPLLQGRRIADVGTGAGLPGIPLAVTQPARHFTLIDSRAKRVRFLRHVVGALGLPNVLIEHRRAEQLIPGARFDTVLARAVAPPAELLAILRPLTRPGSRVLLLTSRTLGQELCDLAEDFARCEIDAVGGPVLRSTIVALERLPSAGAS